MIQVKNAVVQAAFERAGNPINMAVPHMKKQPAPEAEAPAEPSEEVLLLREIRDSLKK